MKLKALYLALLLLMLTACDGFEVVMDELTQQEANLALVLLRTSNISAEKASVSSKKSTIYQIKVKKSQGDEALSILVYHHLPKVKRAGLKEVYPPGSSALIPTKSDEMARLIMASQGEVEGLLKIVPGILDARVVFSFEQPELNREVSKKTASVAIIFTPQENNVPPLTNLEVKELLSASISGLLPEDVAVVQKMHQNPAPMAKSSQNALKDAIDAQWHMLALTLLALIVAGYCTFRLVWQKRKIS